MLTENDVIEILVDYLKLNGYTQIKGLSTLQRGIDITGFNSKKMAYALRQREKLALK